MHRRHEQGTVIVATVIMVLLLTCVSLGLAMVTQGAYRENRYDREAMRCFYVADGALSEAYTIFREKGLETLKATQYPRTMGGLQFRVSVTEGKLDPLLDDGLVRLLASATNGSDTARVAMTVRIDLQPALGVFGDGLVLTNSNVLVDSFDSRVGTYASQISGTRNGIPYARSKAPVASNGNVQLFSNSMFFGDAKAGPSKSVSVDGNSYVSGTIGKATAKTTLKPVTAPVLPVTGSKKLDGPSQTLGPGDYHWSSLELYASSTLTIRGPARIVTEKLIIDSNARLLLDTSGGKVEVYVNGITELKSNAIIRPLDNRPASVSLYGTKLGSSMLLDSNVQVTGRIYAPGVDITLKNDPQVWGSVVGRNLSLDSNAKVHVDEALLDGTSADGKPVKISWQRVP